MPVSATRPERLLAIGRVAALGLVLFGVQAQAGEAAVQRCGWFENPTPANAWFTDRDGEWIVGVQGGPQAEGDWPEFPRYRWVRTNGSYGYGCACMTVEADAATGQVSRIVASRSRPLSRCRADRALKEPKAQ
jgi:Protein of unknown function (DUF4087)